ncbi:MAG: glycoside hydrolase family 127 protein [Chitinophagaceae bacterium]|jgi:DUF1680 family protein|nr:glycoside hydrolase family 127 protein [Chitinophagaceae bacterium]
MRNLLIAIALFFSCLHLQSQELRLRIDPINFSSVEITDDFWRPKMDKVATKTLDACIFQTEVKTGRIRNFEQVLLGDKGKHDGVFYDDSDVYKALEAMAYAIKTTGNTTLEKKADEWIDKIAAAQQPDGYLNTFYTLTGLKDRWGDMSMHEDYCGGHLIEAAVAYADATGKKKLLDVAIKWADHFDSTFGPGKKHWVTGHQELELALVKLYRSTKNVKYLKLADWLLSERGKQLAKGYTWTEWKDTGYAQDLVPVKEQKEITGHAVRAMYMYTGAADVAAYTGDKEYLTAMRTVWEDVVFRNMYITGGIGSAGSNEGFSKDYDLPNEQAYCETCASVGMVFWNQRMNSLTAKGEYADVLERSLYNGALDGLSISGDRFFYGNPLASTGKHARKEWFGTACCPSNIARLISSLGGYIYGQEKNKIFINLFVGSETSIPLQNGDLKIKMQTDYPWSGSVVCKISMAKQESATIAFRIPGWMGVQPSPGGLYRYTDSLSFTPVLKINGLPFSYITKDGYALVERVWRDGDQIVYEMPMPIRSIVSRTELSQAAGRVALQRGPLVYCVEGADNDGKAWNIIAPLGAKFLAEEFSILGEKMVSLVADLPVVQSSADGLSVFTEQKKVRAIPYYAWCNRGSNQMQVWLPFGINDIKINY